MSCWKSYSDNPRAPVLDFSLQNPSDIPNIPVPNNDRPVGDTGRDSDDDVPF